MVSNDSWAPTPNCTCSTACLVLCLSLAQIRATIPRFYMTTQTSLSAATLAHQEHRYPVPGHRPGATRVGDSRTVVPYCYQPTLDAAFLIRGSAIKSRANRHCFNHMRISNRRLKGGPRDHLESARTSRTSACKRAAAKSHPEKVISYRAGGRRMLLLARRMASIAFGHGVPCPY